LGLNGIITSDYNYDSWSSKINWKLTVYRYTIINKIMKIKIRNRIQKNRGKLTKNYKCILVINKKCYI